MADVAPEFVPKAGLAVMPPTQPSSTATIPIPDQNAAKRLTVDTFSPVTQFGSYEYDRVIKQGPVLKRTRRTKVGRVWMCCAVWLPG